MYTQKSMDRFMFDGRNALDDACEHVNMYHVRISPGNSKIGHAWNISTLPIFTCPNCEKCKWHCYDIKSCLRFPGTMMSRAINTAIYKMDPERYFFEIDDFISRKRKCFHFRWHVAGDMTSQYYLDNVVKIAIRRPHFIFWTYTKNYGLINKYFDNHDKPANLEIMMSKWEGMKMDNPHDFPVFSVRLKGMDKKPFKGLFKCPGNCDICKRNHSGCIAGQNTYNDEH